VRESCSLGGLASEGHARHYECSTIILVNNNGIAKDGRRLSQLVAEARIGIARSSLWDVMDLTRHREGSTLKTYDRRAKAFKQHAGEAFLR
jgi:hypothetical protein